MRGYLPGTIVALAFIALGGCQQKEAADGKGSVQKIMRLSGEPPTALQAQHSLPRRRNWQRRPGLQAARRSNATRWPTSTGSRWSSARRECPAG